MSINSVKLDYKFQAEAVAVIRDKLRKTKVLCIVPTGGGKTKIAIDAIMEIRAKARSQGKPMPKILIVVPLSPLVRQFQNSIAKFGDTDLCLKTGILAGSKSTKTSKLAECDLIIAMAQTLESRKTLPWYPLLIIWDEAHLSCFRDCAKIISQLVPKSAQLGLTATPVRQDGQDFNRDEWYWYQPTNTEELIDGGYLVPYTTCSLSQFSLKSKGKDYTISEAEKITSIASPKKVYEDWQPYKHLHTIAFIPSKLTAELYASYFREQGEDCRIIVDETPESERLEHFKAFREKKAILFSVMVLATGFDEPVATVALLLRPTKSIALWIQMVGRVLRTVKGDDTKYIASGKKNMAYLLDFCGNTINPDIPLPHEITDWSKLATPKTKKCPECGWINERKAEYCANCEKEFTTVTRRDREPEDALELNEEQMIELLMNKMNEYKDNRRMIQVRMATVQNPKEYYRYWLQKAFLNDSLPGLAYIKLKNDCNEPRPPREWALHAVFGEEPSFEDFLLYAFYLKSKKEKKEKEDSWLWTHLTNEFGTELIRKWHKPLADIFARLTL